MKSLARRVPSLPLTPSWFPGFFLFSAVLDNAHFFASSFLLYFCMLFSRIYSFHAHFPRPCHMYFYKHRPVPVSYSVFDGPSPELPLVFLHGLFGSKANFTTLAKKLVLQTGRKVLTVDARNHGDSPHSPFMTYEAMSADIHLLLHQLHLHRCVLVGHSMGGKTAMVIALQWEPTIRQFLLTNLVYSEEQFVWRVNLEAVSRHLGELIGFPDFQATYPGLALFLGGSKSGYISSDDYPEIERLFPEAEIQYVSDAGHWVHADQPQEFVAAVCNFLKHPPP
ncbi:protein ABHD11 isoform X4 [Rhineura floridana]|uniref:protein ABHD11 isoform X4 n=1 Tax=Rhineura floridana TaxID=261503 RepID=UPI002AC7F770|nr:protein ABHD11 isoform X4 [Rhineura floridana]